MSNSKYYWLKLQKDFFKRHDIKIIENMPNGKDYIIFYLKLLCESTAHEGKLRFSDEVPYSDEMLSIITDTNIDTVRNAIKMFEELKMIDVLDDGTYFMKQVEKMVGCETEWAEKKRIYREKQKQLLLTDNTETKKDNVRQEIEIEKEIDKEIDKNKKKKKKKDTPPKNKYGEYQNVLLTDDEYNKLHQKYTNADELIKHLDWYIEEKHYKSDSHYIAIIRWVADAVEEKKQRNKNKSTNQQPTTSNPFLQKLLQES